MLVGLCGLPPLSARCATPADSSRLPTGPGASASGPSLPRVGGYIQAHEVAQEQVGLTTALNRARLSIDGSLPSRFTYRALIEMEAFAGARNAATVSLREAIVKWIPRPSR